MEITEVRIKLMEDPSERLQAFCSITLDDCFVIRDLKIIDGANGPFVAMPSRKLTSHCSQCGMKNHLRAAYCNQCGHKLNADRAPRDDDGRAKLYADIAHPINCGCREMIQGRVIQAFHRELEQAKLPGYVSSYDDFDQEAVCVAGERAAERGVRKEAPPVREVTSPAAAASPGSRLVQPAERPQGPHKLPARQATEQAVAANHERGPFGAGIF